MDLPPHGRRGVRIVPALLAGLVLTASCGEEPRAPSRLAAELDLAPLAGTVQVDLAELHGCAERWMEVAAIDPGRMEDRHHLSGGWSFPSRPPEGQEGTIFPLWTDAHEAEIVFLLREIAPRSVEFRTHPFLGEAGGSSRIEVLFNGERVEERVLERGGKRLDLALPESAQRLGLNSLLVRTSDLRRPRDVTPGNGDYRLLGVAVGPLELTIDSARARRRLEQARALVPEGSRVARSRSGAALVEQVSRSVLAWHLRVPPDAVLRADLACLSGAEVARFRVALTTEDGERSTIVERVVAAESLPLEASAELGSWAGEVVRIDFEVEATDGSAAAVLGAWGRPALVAPRKGDGDAAADDRETSGASDDAPFAGAPVVLVLLDALNPRYLGCYGGRAGVSPNVDRLAAEGVLFERAYGPASYTVASVASTLTGLRTWEHGAWSEASRLRDDLPTWPEAFRDAGYRTAAIVHSPNGSSLFGFERGFETFVEVFREPPEGRETPLAEQVLPALDDVLAALESGDDARPPLIWLHLVEPHEPYAAPAPWAGRFSRAAESELDGTAETLWAIREWRLEPDDDDLARLRAQYEENLAYVDDVLGRVLGRLEAAGIADRAVLAVFSDHGEGFCEHRGKVMAGMGHGSTVYEEMARIPLLVRLPGADVPRGARAGEPVSGLDLLPTVADLVGVRPPAGGPAGTSFAGRLLGSGDAAAGAVLSHTYSRRGKHHFLPTAAIWEDEWKYVWTSGDRPELYDLEADPGERRDLANERPVRAAYLRQRLCEQGAFDLEHGGPIRSGDRIELDPELLEQMRALGYAR